MLSRPQSACLACDFTRGPSTSLLDTLSFLFQHYSLTQNPGALSLSASLLSRLPDIAESSQPLAESHAGTSTSLHLTPHHAFTHLILIISPSSTRYHQRSCVSHPRHRSLPRNKLATLRGRAATPDNAFTLLVSKPLAPHVQSSHRHPLSPPPLVI